MLCSFKNFALQKVSQDDYDVIMMFPHPKYFTKHAKGILFIFFKDILYISHAE